MGDTRQVSFLVWDPSTSQQKRSNWMPVSALQVASGRCDPQWRSAPGSPFFRSGARGILTGCPCCLAAFQEISPCTTKKLWLLRFAKRP